MTRNDRGMSDERRRVAALLAELREVYREVDAAHAGWSCESSTDCCHFGRTGREPYVTTIEARLVDDARRARGARVDKPSSRGGDGKRRLALEDAERRCPLLDPSGRCSVYEARPFGCRTYFCDRAVAGERVRQSDVNAFVARIRAIAAAYTPAKDTGIPLGRALEQCGNTRR